MEVNWGEKRKERGHRNGERHLHHIPATRCELQPATLVILILRPEGEISTQCAGGQVGGAVEAQGEAACHS